MGYYDEEFNEIVDGLFNSNVLIALELKNIANELHQSNTITLGSVPTHMTLDSNGATLHYGLERGVRPGDK